MESVRDNTARRMVRGPPRGAGAARRGGSRARSRSTTCSASSCCKSAPGVLQRHLLDGARTQHTTLLAPDLGPGVTLCAPLDSLPFRSDSIDAILLPHTLELVEDPVRGAARGRARAVRRGLPDDLRLQSLQRLGRAPRRFAQYFRPPGVSAADPAPALRAPAARLGGAAGLRCGQRLRLSRAAADEAAGCARRR